MRIGIFGGTFNPPHIGHLKIANAIADKLKLQKVLIIPAAIPPHKEAHDLASGEDRLKMCEMTFGGNHRYLISDLELRRAGRSYSYDTLCALKKKYPEDELFMIVGSDMLESFNTWFRYKDILSMCTLCAASRESDFKVNLEKIFEKDEIKKVMFIDIDVTEMSSTQVRKAITDGRDTKGLLVPQVSDYIKRKGLYTLNVPEKYKDYDNLLKKKLDEHRYVHSLGVAKSARMLAEIYGEDSEKAYFAGLMHDVTKNTPYDEQLQIMQKSGIILTPCELNNKKLWHAISGSAYLKNELKIEDEDVLSAVRWHTTGRENMTKFEKIIYVADLISPERKYPDVEEVRRLSKLSLEEAMLHILKFCIANIVGDNMVVDVNTVNCYNDLIIKEMKKGK